jgi:flavin reductase (DIM6/NTAB) family NADH-FMN oxidoreductase RutF
MNIVCRDTKIDELYNLLIQTVVPRPIAWVSSRSKNISNLAPFSFFNVLSVNPPILGFSPGYKRPGPGQSGPQPKDTLRNIKETGCFAVNIVSLDLAEQMNASAANFAPDVSEFAALGITEAPGNFVDAPRVAEARVSLECRTFHLHELGGSCLVLGEIIGINIDDRIINDGVINLDILQPVGRLGGNWYATVKDRFELARPARPD